jgi:hypothetical protein
MVMIDAQTVKGDRAGPTFHEAGGRGGRTIGAKRTVLIEIMGLPVGAHVESAKPHDVSAGGRLIHSALPALATVTDLLADRGYRGLTKAAGMHHARVQIKAPAPGQSGFKPIAPLYKIEHAFAQLGRWRRLSRCFEQTQMSAEAWLHVAAFGYLLGRGHRSAARSLAPSTANQDQDRCCQKDAGNKGRTHVDLAGVALARRRGEATQGIGGDGHHEAAVEDSDQDTEDPSPRRHANDHVARRQGRQCEWQEDNSATRKDQAADCDCHGGPSHRKQDHAPGAPGRPTNGSCSADGCIVGAHAEPPSAPTFLAADLKVKPIGERRRYGLFPSLPKPAVRIQNLRRRRRRSSALNLPDPSAAATCRAAPRRRGCGPPRP